LAYAALPPTFGYLFFGFILASYRGGSRQAGTLFVFFSLGKARRERGLVFIMNRVLMHVFHFWFRWLLVWFGLIDFLVDGRTDG
jgi:hypothetical protein